jgi:hypothetical protein
LFGLKFNKITEKLIILAVFIQNEVKISDKMAVLPKIKREINEKTNKFGCF